MTYPNVIIAGAPKCGTSSIFHYLSQHPDVCVSNIKETRFFIDKTYSLFNKKRNYYKDGTAGYEIYFDNCRRKNAKIVLEATPDYLYQNLALSALKQLPEIPKLIFVIRKPSDRIYSLYNFAVNNMAVLKKRISFSDYIEILKINPSHFKGKDVLMYAIEHSRYVNYLANWLDTYGENVNVFLYEELKRDPCIFMKKVSMGLDIDIKFFDTISYPRQNATFLIRNQGLQRIKRKLTRNKFVRNTDNHALASPVQCIKDLIKIGYGAINLKEKKIEKTISDRQTLKELDKEFELYNRRLSQYMKINLALWYEQEFLKTN